MVCCNTLRLIGKFTNPESWTVVLLGWLLFHMLLSGCNVTATTEIGCCQDNARDRNFSIPATNVYCTSLDLKSCRYACANGGYSHSAAQQGNLCFCGNAVSSCSSSTGCNVPCSGKATETCGGANMENTVHTTPHIIKGLDIMDPGVLVTYASSSLNITQTSGIPTSYKLQAQDGSGTQSYTSSPLSHHFRKPGKYAAVVIAADAENNEVQVGKIVQVQTSIKKVELTCPEAVEIYTVFECSLEIKQGTDLSATVTFDDGKVTPMIPADSLSYQLGLGEWGVTSLTSTASTTFVMFNHVTRYNGTVVGWEYNAKTAGVAAFYVFRPTCNGGKYFCLRSYTCVPDGTNCKQQTNKWSKKCDSSANQIYSFAKQACINKNTGETIFQDFVTSSWSNVAVDSMAVVYEKSVSLTVGINYLSDDAGFFALAGDVVAVKEDTGVLYHDLTTSACNELSIPNNQVPSVGASVAISTLASNGGCKNNRHMLVAHMVQPSILMFSHNYTKGLDVYNMTADVDNVVTDSTVSDFILIDVQEVIQSVRFNVSQIGVTNATIEFSTWPHTGNKVTYNWTFGDGQENLTTIKDGIHIFTEAGVYTITLIAWNKISQANWTETIIIQDYIMNLVVTPRSSYPEHATVLGQLTEVDFTISQGTNVTYFFTLGDGNNVTLYHDQAVPPLAQHNGLSGYLGYKYDTFGNYTYNLTVSNLVSSASSTWYFPVQIPIQKFSIVQPPPVAIGEMAEIRVKMSNGSHVQFTGIFAGVQIRNFSYDDFTFMGTVHIDNRDHSGMPGIYNLTVTATNLVSGTNMESASVNVQYNLTNLAIAVDRPFVPTSEDVAFNVTMRWGSAYTVSIDWGDSNQQSQLINLTNPGEYLLYKHKYISPNSYKAVFTFTNIFGVFLINKTIVVQNLVKEMVFVAATPVPLNYSLAATASLTITFIGHTKSPVVALATNPFVFYSYGDDSNFTTALTVAANVPKQDSYIYHHYGTYNLTLNISNFVNHMFFERTIDVDKKIENVLVYGIPLNIKAGFSSTITVEMTWGSRMTLLYDFKDNSNVVQYIDHFNQTMESSHVYTQPGIYPISVVTTNTIDNITTIINESITVQHPITNLHLTCTLMSLLQKSLGYVEQVQCDLWLDNSTPEPTSVYMEVDWGDGKSTPLFLIPANPGIVGKSMNTWKHYYQFKHTAGYTKGGEYTVEIATKNLVSSAGLNFSHTVYEEIVGLTKNLFAIDNTTGNRSNGYGPSGDSFRLEEPVLFSSSFLRGSHVTYEWDFGDGVTKTVYNQADIVYKYLAPGTYSVRLNASNPLNSDVIEKTIVVQRQVMNVEIWTQSPWPKNRTYTFMLNTGNIGSDACYFIKLGDENATYDYYFVGNESQCITSFPNEWGDNTIKKGFDEKADSYFENAKSTSGDPNVTFTNHYMTVGVYDVVVIGENVVSKQEVSFRVVVTKGPCFNPIVDLDTPNLCTIGEECFEGHRTYKKSVTTYVYTKIRFNCEATHIAHFTWSAASFDAYGNEQEIDLQNTKTYSSGLYTLVVDRRILPYGVVKFYLNVSMDDVPGVETIESVRLKIIKSPLAGEIAGGQEKSKKWNTNVTMDAKTYVFDPDIGPNDWTGITWKWYCKRRCETWPKSFVSSNYQSITDPTDFTTNCTYNVKVLANKGCFQFDTFDGPGEISQKKGIITVDTFQVVENDVIDVIAVATKDTRSVVMKQTVKVIDGDPPDISIQCVTNCAVKLQNNKMFVNVNPTGRFSMLSIIAGWKRGMVFDYWWSLYMFPDNYDRNNLENYKRPNAVWEYGASTGISSDNMAIDPGVFINYPTKGYFYRLKVEALRYGSSPDNKGWGTKDFIINEPPVAGECDMLPPIGQALETLFNVNCSQDFFDEELPLSYQIGYRKNTTGMLTWFYSGLKFHMDNAVNLPAGYAERNRSIDIIIRATDVLGSFTDIKLQVTVNPASAEKVTEVLNNITSNPAAFAESLSQSSPTEAAQSVMTIGEVLNDRSLEEMLPATTTAAPVDLSNPDLSEADKQAAVEAQYQAEIEQQIAVAKAQEQLENQRELIVSGLASVDLPDLASINQANFAAQTVGAKPEQLNANARDSMISIVSNSLDLVIGEADKDDVMADDLEAAVSTVMGSIGLIAESIFTRTSDTSSTTTTTTAPATVSGYTVTKTDAQKEFEAEQARKAQEEKDKSRQQINTILNILSATATALRKKKVPGERATAMPNDESASARMVLDKAFSRDSNNREIKGDSNNKIILPMLKAILGEGNETSYFLQSVSVRFTKNVYTYGNQTNMTQNTMLQSLVLYNDTGGVIPCADLPDTFEIKLDSTNKTAPATVYGDMDSNLPVRVIDLRANNALHVNLKQYYNTTTENGTQSSTNSSSDSKDGGRWNVYLKLGSRPSTTDYDYNCTLPLSEQQRLDMVKNYKTAKKETQVVIPNDQTFASGSVNINNSTSSYITMTTDQMSTELPLMTTVVTSTQASSSEYILPDQWTCFFSNAMLNNSQTIKAYIGIEYVGNETSDNTQASDTSSSSDPVMYVMMLYTSQCLWWNEDQEEWLTTGCTVRPMTDYNTTYCGCNHLTSFGGGMYVPMNTIDLSESAFTKLDENPIVFATMVSIMCLYVACAIWARRMDLKDEVAAGSTALLDNDPRNKYLYEMLVITGQRRGAGTTAKVRFILTGDQTETGPRLLWDDKRPVLQRKSIDSFIMAVDQPLGNLMHLRIWHDNEGNNPSWYFGRMQITDMQTGQKFYFMCDRWLAVEEDDGMIDRIVPVAGMAELTSFNHLFWTKTQKNLTDGHIWFSVFQRPPRSRFTRVQRLTCCLALLFSSMMANILFYNQDGVVQTTVVETTTNADGSTGTTQTTITQTEGVQVYRLGPISFTLSQVYVGIISGLIAFPASIIIVSLFRYSAERPSKRKVSLTPKQQQYRQPTMIKDNPSSRQSTSLTDEYSNQRQTSISGVDFVESELKQQKEFLDTGDVAKRLLLHPTTPAPEYGVSYVGVGDNNTPTVLHAEIDQKKYKNEKKKFMLPWWCVIIGYILALITIGVAFWMTVEVAGVFGAQKSKDWLFSFAISVLESVFLSQPLKVLLMAVFFALLCKKPEEEEDDRPKHLKPNEEWLHTHLTEKDMKDANVARMLKKYEKGPMVLDEEYVKAAREKRFKELKMYAIIREVIFYTIFLYLMMMVAYGNRDPNSINMYKNFKTMFHGGSYHLGLQQEFSIDKVHSRDDLWNWLKYVALPTLYHPYYYDGNNYPFMAGYIADNQAYLVGEGRLRMLRVHQDPCSKSVQEYFPSMDCTYSYQSADLDEGQYKKGWVLPNRTAGETEDQFWKYRSRSELHGYPYWGKHATYSGGGFVAELGKTMTSAEATMDELVQNRWLTDETRALFVEFLVYSPNANLYIISQIVFEYPETGACFSYYKVHIMRLNRYVGTWMFIVMAAELLTLLFIVFYIYKEIRKLIKEKKSYFSSFWNCVELFILSLCIVALVMFFYRLFIGQRVESRIKENPQIYHNFQYVILWDEIYTYLLGVIIFLSTVKFLKLLRFNQRMSLLTSTIRYAAKGLFSYLVMFTVVFSAFVQLTYLMFYAVLLDFSSFIRSAETMFSLMLNKFDFQTMREADRIWAPVIIFLFTIFVSFIMVNIFITIVIEAYYRVRYDISKQSNEYEIVDFMVAKFKLFAGIGLPKKNKKKKGEEEDLQFDPDEYIDGIDSNAATAEELRERVMTMLDKLEMHMYHTMADKQMMDEVNRMTAKQPRRIFVSS